MEKNTDKYLDYRFLEKKYNKTLEQLFFCPHCINEISKYFSEYEINKEDKNITNELSKFNLHWIVKEGFPADCPICKKSFYSEDGLFFQIFYTEQFSIVILDNIIKTVKEKKINITEKDIENEFVKNLNVESKQQVITKLGIIDILTDEYIYEVKKSPNLSDMHKAYGQLKHYQQCYPDRKLAIVANTFPENYFNNEVEIILQKI